MEKEKKRKLSGLKGMFAIAGCTLMAMIYTSMGLWAVVYFAETDSWGKVAGWAGWEFEEGKLFQDSDPEAASAFAEQPSEEFLEEPKPRFEEKSVQADEGNGQEGKAEADEESVSVASAQTVQAMDNETVMVSDVTEVVKAAMPCVVAITNEYTAYDYWFDRMIDEESNGSGIIVGQTNDELLIVTNYHVIEDCNDLYVQFIDDSETTAYVKGTASENDLAVISVFKEDIANATLGAIAIAALGDSNTLQVGEPAIAIGNSLGYGQSVTTGVISALNRDIFADDPDINQGYLIQTDAAINPGNSGGALLNVRGEVIGINSSKIADYVIEGMGYAIPITTAKPIIDELVKMETRKKVAEDQRAFLGISGNDVSEEAVEKYDMPEGVYVADLVKGSAAEQYGIRKGDIIVAVNGEKITQMTSLQNILEYYAAGTEIEVTLMRQQDGAYHEIKRKVILGHKEG